MGAKRRKKLEIITCREAPKKIERYYGARSTENFFMLPNDVTWNRDVSARSAENN
jgi:hypothetical protein